MLSAFMRLRNNHMRAPAVKGHSRRDVFSPGYVSEYKKTMWRGVLPKSWDYDPKPFVVNRDRSGLPYCEVDERLAWGHNWRYSDYPSEPSPCPPGPWAQKPPPPLPSAPKYKPMWEEDDVETKPAPPAVIEQPVPLVRLTPEEQREQRMQMCIEKVMDNYARYGVPCSPEKAREMILAHPDVWKLGS